MEFHRRGALLVLTLLGLAAAIAPALGQVGPTVIVGGPGGGEYQDQCGYSSALVGLVAVKSKDVNSLAGLCQLLVDGHPTGPKTGLITLGNPNIDYRANHTTSSECPADMVVEGVSVQVSKVNLVHSLAVICRNLVTGERKGGHYLDNGYGGEAAREELASCGVGAYAVGTIIHYGEMIDALGLLCQVAAPAPTPVAPPPPPAPTPPPPPDKPPLQVDNGDNGGGGATAATDTTIYDQPGGNNVAYLSAGDPVTIVGCNEDNWCEISQPEAGWVWGEDLNH